MIASDRTIIGDHMKTRLQLQSQKSFLRLSTLEDVKYIG